MKRLWGERISEVENIKSLEEVGNDPIKQAAYGMLTVNENAPLVGMITKIFTHAQNAQH